MFCSSKFNWGSYIAFNAKTVSNKIGTLPRSIKFLSFEVVFFLFRSTIRKVSLRVTTPFCFFPFSCQVLFFRRSNSPSHKNFLVPPLQTYFFNDTFLLFNLKCRVTQIEKALINDRLRLSKVSWKFRISSIYNFVVIYPWNLLFSSICYILTVSIAFYVYKKTVRLNELKTRGAMIAKISVFVICVEAMILYNLHDCTFRTERK